MYVVQVNAYFYCLFLVASLTLICIDDKLERSTYLLNGCAFFNGMRIPTFLLLNCHWQEIIISIQYSRQLWSTIIGFHRCTPEISKTSPHTVDSGPENRCEGKG